MKGTASDRTAIIVSVSRIIPKAVLYLKSVRNEMKKLRGCDEEGLLRYNQDSIDRRLAWFKEHEREFTFIDRANPVESAYRLLLRRFGITEREAPVVRREKNCLTFHSRNFCPTLEACKILGLDTRHVCKLYNEESTDLLVKQIDPRLRFDRNYAKLRPYAEYCEEMILLE